MNPRAPAKPSKSPPSSWLWALLGALIVVTGLTWYFWHLTQGPRQSAAPVTQAPPSPPAARNAFEDFSTAIDLLVAPPRDDDFSQLLTQAWTGPWRDDDRLARYLERNTSALAALDRGLQRPECFLPEYRNPESSLAYLDPLRELARLKSLRVKQAIAAGHAESVVTDAGQIVRFGDMVMRGGGPLPAYQMGIAIKHIGYDALQHVLAAPMLDAGSLNELLALLTPCELDNGALERMLKLEHATTAFWLLDAAARSDFESVVTAVTGGRAGVRIQNLLRQPGTFVVEETGNIMERLFAMAMHNATSPWQDREGIEGTLGHALQEPFDVRKEPNSRGLVVLHLIFDNVPDALVHQRRIETEAAAVHALIVLAEYHRAHGDLPDTLTDTPVDPFCGEPLRYSKSPARVWSVGPDGVDNRGAFVYDAPGSKGDLVFAIPFADAELPGPRQ